MNAGSEGSEIMGLDFGTYYININTSDIVIKRNLFASASGDVPDFYSGYINLGSEANNTLILQNYSVQINGANYANTGVLIANNIISYGAAHGGESNIHPSLDLHPYTSAVVQNNIFRRGIVRAHKATFTNNIMVNGVFEKNENMASNNIGNGTQFGTEDGNKSNIDMSTVFIGTGSPDARWKLKTGSPAIGAGYGSTTARPVDAGIFGGSTPYKLSGLPGIPVIYFINVQGVGSNADPIDVTVKVRSTN